MRHVRKFFKYLFLTCILAIVAAVVVNSQTDVFIHIERYAPSFYDKYPLLSKMIADAAVKVELLTEQIPSPSELAAKLRHEEMPVNPEDLAVNAYISDSPMLNFYPQDNIGIRIGEDGDSIEVFGVTSNERCHHFIAALTNNAGEDEQNSFSASASGEFCERISIPDSESDEMRIDVYAGERPYGEFSSWVYNYVPLQRNESGIWQLKQSPVYDWNKSMYEADRSMSEALKNTFSIESENNGIIELARSIIADSGDDYTSALLLHDWVCSYLYYDIDNLNSESTVPYYATQVLQNRRAVCLGFATLYAALCRSVNIPCNVVSGYALGISDDTVWSDANINTEEQNHAWNEVYADGRWVITDTTWDTANKIENGAQIDGEVVSHLYFDSNLWFFSQNHKIIEYSKSR